MTKAPPENNEPLDPIDWIRSELKRLSDHLRPEDIAVDASAGAVRMKLPFRPEFHAPDGQEYDSGVIASFIDLTAQATVAVNLGKMIPSINIRVDFLRDASATDLQGRGLLRQTDGSITLVDVEITDDAERLVAVGQVKLSDPDKPLSLVSLL